MRNLLMCLHLGLVTSQVPSSRDRAAWLALGEPERMSRFLDLAPRLGIACPKVGVSSFVYPQLGRRLRGAIALADVEPMEELCVVPESQLISLLTLRNTTLEPLNNLRIDGRPLRGWIKSLWEAIAISVFIIRESARPFSVFTPYIHSSFNGHDPASIPKTWSQNSTKFAGLSPPVQQLVQHWQSQVHAASKSKHMCIPSAFLVRAVYQVFFSKVVEKYLPAFSEGGVCGPSIGSCLRFYSIERLMDVLAVVQAREWSLRMHSAERQFLAPLIDLLNYGQMGVRVSFDNARRVFIAVARKRIAKGDEILFYYGSFCIDYALLTYGFVPEGSRECHKPQQRSRPKAAASNVPHR